MTQHKFSRAKKEVEQMLGKIIREDYPDTLHKAKSRIDILMCEPQRDEMGSPKGPALTHHGAPAYATIQIVPLDRRALGMGDAIIKIDAEFWNRDTTTDAHRKALLDHELYHLKLKHVEGEETGFKTDDLDRPLFAMREHDYQFGWFVAIAARHGAASIEVQQALMIQQNSPQLLFNFGAEQLHIVDEAPASAG